MVKFLIVRFSSIGDIVLTSPVARHLKQQVEGAEVHYLTKAAYAPLLEANPHIDKVHRLEDKLSNCLSSLQEEGFDYIIDLHHNLRSARVKFKLKRIDFSVNKLNWKKWLLVRLKINRLPDLHMAERNLETIRSFIDKKDGKGLEYFIPEQEEVDLSTLPAAFQSAYIALSIGAQHATKKLPPEALVQLCSKLEEPVLILGGKEDREIGEQIIASLPDRDILNCCGLYSIHGSASLVRQSSVLITHDTGLMHVGAAFEKKIVSIWGNTHPAFGMSPWKAHPDSRIFEVQDLKCRPCSKIGYAACPKKHFRCMRDQDLDEIARVSQHLFSGT